MRILYSILLVILAPVLAVGQLTEEDRTFFENKIRPTLALECYECHNSHGKAKGGLVLDYAGGLLDGGDSGPSIVPGKPDTSLLLQVMRHEIEGLRMPKGGPKVDGAITDDFAEWIRRGAPDPRQTPPTKDQLDQATSWDTVFKSRQSWWSFQPVAAHQAEKTIDDFLDAKLEQAGLSPVGPAEPRVLLRRLSYALTGLPPTREEIAAFLKHGDLSREIDRLLDSPAFGERWARHWMDWWRYADSHGSEGDPRIAHAWQYRDYLIRALNADIPYDQLLREHVAGDLLAEPRLNEEMAINESAIGPAHFRMVFHGFAPTDALDELVRFTDNQVDVLTKASMGLTVSCARCHDHKFDAISQADFTALYGIMSSTRPGYVPIDTPERRDLHKAELQTLKQKIRGQVADAWRKMIDDIDEDSWNDVKAEQREHPLYAWRQPADAQTLASQAPPEAKAATHWKGMDLADWYFSGTAMPPNSGATPHVGPKAPVALAGEFVVKREGDKIFDQLLPTGLYTHLLSDKHSGTFTSPNFHIGDTTKSLDVKVLGGGDARLRYVVQNYPRQGTVYPLRRLNRGLGWEGFGLDYWRGDDAHVELTTAAEGPIERSDQARSWFGITEVAVLEEGQARPPEDPARAFRAVFDQEMDKFVPPRHYKRALRKAVHAWTTGLADEATDDERAAYESRIEFLAAFVQHGLLPTSMEQIPGAEQTVAEYRKLEAGIQLPIRVPGLIESAGRDAPLYIRGNHKTPGDPVPRRFLDTVDNEPFQSKRSGRLELAEHILADNNPFTSRVLVNRLWHHLFGTGLFATPDNLGRLGEKPSHPELLDQLAQQFVADGWSLKTAIKHIVSSEAFQRASTPVAAAAETDPDNRLLSYYPVRRLEAEAIRDTMVALSGSADRRMFGPGAHGNSRRRSVYVDTIRNRRDPFLQTFDAPEPLTTRGRRNITNVPGQSLTLLNDPRVIQLAGQFAAQKRGATDSARIDDMYEAALGRLPTDNERDRALAYVHGLDAAEKQALAEMRQIDKRIAEHRGAIHAMLKPAREKILATRGTREKPAGPKPVAHWDFEEDGKDLVAGLPLYLNNSASLENGGLKVGGLAHAVSASLPFDLGEKTLVASVKLNTLKQRAGGVMTVQTGDGHVFDAIVFAEQQPRQWLAGSDGFRRTEPLQGDEEREAHEQPVTLALSYAADGTITAYRNGQPYGRPIRKQAKPVGYAKDNAVVVFGCRHTPADHNRVLDGSIMEAMLFDRALDPREIAAASGFENTYVSEKELLASLEASQRVKLKSLRVAIAELEEQRRAFQGVETSSPQQAWNDLAQAIFNLKEFIYLR